MNLKGRVAVITGAAGGIGRAMAQSLARCGCRLALADIDEVGLAQTEAQAVSHGVCVSRHRLDVANHEEVASLPLRVLEAHERVDLLFNNAGVALRGEFEEVSEADFDWLMEINFHSVVRMTRAFLPILRASDDARIINMSSILGIVSIPGQTAYCASKFAVRGFSDALRHELTGTRVGVSVVHPGGVATNIARSARSPKGAPEAEVRRQMELAQRALRMPADKAGEIIVRGAERRRARIVLGWDAAILTRLERMFPVHYWRLLSQVFPK